MLRGVVMHQLVVRSKLSMKSLEAKTTSLYGSVTKGALSLEELLTLL